MKRETKSEKPTHARVPQILALLLQNGIETTEAMVRHHIRASGIPRTDDGWPVEQVMQVVLSADKRTKRGTGYRDERERKLKLEADLLQIKLDVEAKRLIPAETVCSEFAAVASAVKSDMLALASSLPGRLEGLPATDISEILTEAIQDALRHCSKNIMEEF